MKINTDIPSMIEYVQQHWFKLLLLMIVLYLFTQKDFSFSINLSDPDQQEVPLKDQQRPKAVQKKEYFTEQTKEQPGILDRFDLSPFFGKNNKSVPLEALHQIEEDTRQAYLKRFAKVVIEERRKFGIPSSILLASAFLHSYAGTRSVTTTANNHFGLTCTYDWSGPISKQSATCYRKYENAWMSFRDNSLYLSSGKFANLQSLGATDYKAWATQLEKLGYSEYENMAAPMIQIIEMYGLDELDRR